MKKYSIWASLCILSLVVMTTYSAEQTASKPAKENVKLATDTEVVVLDTDAGVMVVRFFEDKAPKHAESFKKLAKEGFYDGTKFHRVIKGFMIQGGDPNTKKDDPYSWGTGGPGYNLKAEFNDIKHDRGTLSMARSSDPNSAGSQFFVMHGRAPHLDGQYTVFGQLVDGDDVLEKIATAEVKPFGREVSRPVNPVAIKKATLTTWGEYQQNQEKK